MDDLQLIRQTLDAPPPSARATFQARGRLDAAIGGSAPVSARRFPVRLRWSLSGGVVLAAVAGVVLATTAAHPEHADRGGTTQVLGDRSAQTILLAAATRAGADKTGKYWHVETIAVAGPQRVGTAPDQYNLVDRSATANWIARDPEDTSWTGTRDLGWRPDTEADQRAWSEAGSPKQWDLSVDGSVDGSPAGTRRLTMTAGKGQLSPVDSRTTYLQDLGGFDLTQIQQLPTNPSKLRALLLSRMAAAGLTAGSSGADTFLFGAVSQLLLDVPAPPAVRAAAFTVLAGIPGVDSVGTVKDADGRQGLGIEMNRTSPGGFVERHQLILDSSTYVIMGESFSGSQGAAAPIKHGESVVVAAEWTDQKPEPPAAS
ncbi:CU044_5270 family protein [Rugosimonospora africana]|uniref:CU044_5270 family protein n=1 Tax=Rugosimonospora africana TaxID=556532 RepID=A0A8J3VP84_9ACTN|nr:CU044_5270 family protein [Rugosimonospora africana]GIH13018.1 hypothetical protein Raf01_11900 [Rugosimonospora africana]